MTTYSSANPKSYPLGPDALPRDGVTPGTVTEHILAPGRLYPGTPHHYIQYLPACDTDDEYAVFVVLDGSLYEREAHLSTVLDNLIAAGDIPPTVGIFVDPGVHPSRDDSAQSRFERSYEYDGLSDRFATFLTEELLPEVGGRVPLSPDPDRRVIMGASTGAVGAFMAAWNRPDAFHRVITGVGTFVAMRGADTIAALVRKTEARPLRIWLQADEFDHITPAQPYGTFYAGSWPVASRTLHEGLQFSGYDVHLEMGLGVHSLEHSAALVPDALRWIWPEYPSNGVTPIVSRPPTALGGPGWDTRGSIWDTVRGVADWEQANLGTQVSHLTVNTAGEAVGHIGAASPGPHGSVFVADPVAHTISLSTDPAPLFSDLDATAILWDEGQLLYVLESGRVGVAEWARPEAGVRWIDLSLDTASALALSPDRGWLVISDSGSRHQWLFALDTSGLPLDGEPFFRLEALDDLGSARGVTVDSTGQVYFASALGVQICEPIGRVAMILPGPHVHLPVDDVIFGGAARDVLYIVQAGRVFRRQMKVHGALPGAPTKPAAPPL